MMDYFNQESERLTYRKASKEDLESWLEFFRDNDRLSFLGMDLTKDHETLAMEWIDRQLERYATQGLGNLAVIEKQSGQMIGMGGILPRELDGKELFEIAYSLKPAYWGKGYGTEIARQMKQFGQKHEIAGSFISIIHKDNEPSMHVARKNSMLPLYETTYLGMDVCVYGDSPVQ